MASFENRKVAHLFDARPYNPTGLLYCNGHYQTIVGSGALRKMFFGHPSRDFVATEERMHTPDDDYFVVEYTENFDASRDAVIIVHGLESNGKSGLVSNMATALMRAGFGCCLFNFRGCHGEDNNTPAGYHVGFTTDLLLLIDHVNARHPGKRLFITGFSLGGNVTLKLLGELGNDAVKKNVYGGAVFCVPFDPAGCQKVIDVGMNRLLYSNNFLATLKAKAERQILRFPGAFDIEKVRASTTIGDYDDHVVAAVYGFKDKFDYYRQCGSKWYLHKIRVPTIAINALDDPFIDPLSLPTAEDVGDACVRLIYHNHGGHCGFAGVPSSESGWIADEIARCIQHIAHGVDCL